MNAVEAIARLQEIKSQALALRADGDLAGAIQHLRSGVEVGRKALAAKQDARDAGSVGWELADCLGMLGGNLLRQGEVSDAIEVFREGRDLEMGSPDEIGLTYNTVNLVVARLLAGGWETLQDSSSDLEEVSRRLDARVAGSDAGDLLWVWADLGMCEFLRGGLDAARSAYTTAARLANAEERRSMLARLQLIEGKCPPASEAVQAFLDAADRTLA